MAGFPAMWRDRLNVTGAFLQLTAHELGAVARRSAPPDPPGEGLEEVGTGGLILAIFDPKSVSPDPSPETHKSVGDMGADTAWI